MPCFYFHVYDDAVTVDDEGQSLPDEAEARARAVEEARQLACQEVLGGHLGLGHRIEVANASGEVVTSVAFRDAVEIREG